MFKYIHELQSKFCKEDSLKTATNLPLPQLCSYWFPIPISAVQISNTEFQWLFRPPSLNLSRASPAINQYSKLRPISATYHDAILVFNSSFFSQNVSFFMQNFHAVYIINEKSVTHFRFAPYLSIKSSIWVTCNGFLTVKFFTWVLFSYFYVAN